MNNRISKKLGISILAIIGFTFIITAALLLHFNSESNNWKISFLMFMGYVIEIYCFLRLINIKLKNSKNV